MPRYPFMSTGPPAESVRRAGLVTRLHRALGPILGGLALDLADFASFGPMAIWLGPVFGAIVGLWIASIYRFGAAGRVLWAAVAAAYCAAPFTELVPLATMISAVARFTAAERRE